MPIGLTRELEHVLTQRKVQVDDLARRRPPVEDAGVEREERGVVKYTEAGERGRG